MRNLIDKYQDLCDLQRNIQKEVNRPRYLCKCGAAVNGFGLLCNSCKVCAEIQEEEPSWANDMINKFQRKQSYMNKIYPFNLNSNEEPSPLKGMVRDSGSVLIEDIEGAMKTLRKFKVKKFKPWR